MEINFITRYEVPFEAIAIGDCFIYDDVVYLKIPDVIRYTEPPYSSFLHNAIVMDSGKLDSFSSPCLVYKCKATLTVEK